MIPAGPDHALDIRAGLLVDTNLLTSADGKLQVGTL